MSEVSLKKFLKNTEGPFIIAEMSGNHAQKFDKALKIIDKAAECGVDAIKLQTYTPDTMTLNVKSPNFYIEDKKSLWQGEYLYDLYEKAYTPWAWHEDLFKYANSKGLICFSTPFDETAVDFLEKINCPLYKISSFENNDLSLIRKVCGTGKPVIISLGVSTMQQIINAVETAKDANCKHLTILKCTSSYPADASHANLKTLDMLKKLFKCEVGISDHTQGFGVAIASVAMGASVIEKHFIDSDELETVDSEFSLLPDKMSLLVEESARAYKALGEINFKLYDSEINSLKFKRSLYVTNDMQVGEIFTKHNIRAIRPGNGLDPQYYQQILGRKIKKSAKKGEPLSWELIT